MKQTHCRIQCDTQTHAPLNSERASKWNRLRSYYQRTIVNIKTTFKYKNLYWNGLLWMASKNGIYLPVYRILLKKKKHFYNWNWNSRLNCCGIYTFISILAGMLVLIENFIVWYLLSYSVCTGRSYNTVPYVPCTHSSFVFHYVPGFRFFP